MREVRHEVDFCIVGGGMTGVCAAIAAARNGAKVLLMHDRPVLGGNASSEIRMWICGAHGPDNRETGILEEIQMENLYRNPNSNYSIWDTIVYEKVRFEKNIKLLMNCTCTDAKMDGNKIESIMGWQLTTETWHTVSAKLFSDCSGDSILAPLTGAEFRIGREASSEFNESIAPDVSDKKTMGMSCLFQLRETDRPQKFIPPTWANKYKTDEDFPLREHHFGTNFWWIELGGDRDSIHDTEELKDELLKIAYGVWDHIKNHGDHGAENYVIDWIGFLPGKRESRRYIGDHIITQNDVESGGKFDDIVAYGGWSMDDHFPAGMNHRGSYPTIFHPAPSPYGIPFRSLYSRNIENLFCAGRNISATHAALSSTRVMGTCSIIGQAVGTAAAITVKHSLTPRGVYNEKISELQTQLMDDDCYIPWHKREISLLARNATLTTSGASESQVAQLENLRNGLDRPIGGESNSCVVELGEKISFEFEKPEFVSEARIVFDSNLNRKIHNLNCIYRLEENEFVVQPQLVKDFSLEFLTDDAKWEVACEICNNYQRLVTVKIERTTKGVRLIPKATWGAEQANIFSFDVR